ncbi:hypothetical protein [Novosphingobium huizhouense]|uniref:hypothetical protein n=1 Tax=Novosphingobium huizhouense TaxID=2866625 RepID=UPI001CD8C048|nr:hypothetical protein [Novosphingobium huizhouense]
MTSHRVTQIRQSSETLEFRNLPTINEAGYAADLKIAPGAIAFGLVFVAGFVAGFVAPFLAGFVL